MEAHSIAGLSGSPVFWNVPTVRVVNNDLQFLPDVCQTPIGIFIGYHVIASREDEMIVPEFQVDPSEWEKPEKPTTSPDEKRTGFGVVLPIHYIFEMFESDMVMSEIERTVEERRRGSGYRPASAAASSPKPIQEDERAVESVSILC